MFFFPLVFFVVFAGVPEPPVLNAPSYSDATSMDAG